MHSRTAGKCCAATPKQSVPQPACISVPITSDQPACGRSRLSHTAHCLLPTHCHCLPLPPNLKPKNTEGCLASRCTRAAEGVVTIIPTPLLQKSLSSYVVARCTGGSLPAFGFGRCLRAKRKGLSKDTSDRAANPTSPHGQLQRAAQNQSSRQQLAL